MTNHDVVIGSDPCAGIIEETMRFILYPNPFNEELFIKSNEAIFAQLKVFATDGRIVYENRMNGKLATLNLPGLSQGNYLMKIEYNGNIYYKMLLKQ